MKAYNILSIALAGAALASCSDLDTAPESSYVTEQQKEETIVSNPDRVFAAVTGISASMSRFQAYSSDHNDFGYPAVMLGLDSRGTDMVSKNNGYNWFANPSGFYDYTSTAAIPMYAWYGMYNQIRACNSLLLSIPEEADDEQTYYHAEGLAFRSFAYWQLAQIFQFNYTVNQDAPCVPLITEANEAEATANGCARATVKETYGQIISDISTAIDLLSSTDVTAPYLLDSKPNRLIDLDVAYALRARYYLSMHEYGKAAEDAQTALQLTSARPYSMQQASVPAFNSMDEQNWMWGIPIAETDRVVTSGIINWPSHMGSLNYGYASVGAWRMIAQDLYNSIPETDVRKGWWLDENGESANLNTSQAGYLAYAGCPPYAQVKFAPYQNVIYQSVNANDIPLMRVEEIYLMLAEAQGMSNVGAGKATLEQFVKTYRDPSYTCAAATSEELQEECWRQRRIELWGEGLSYWDIMRLNKGIDRRGGGWEEAWIYDIPAGDPVLVYQIPQREQESNKLCTPNPSGSKPQPVTE